MKSIIFMLLILLAESCNLFEKSEQLLVKYKKNNGDKINVYYVELGATTNDAIQVRITKPGEEERLIKSFEKNFLQSSKLNHDTLLQLILSDTGYRNYNNKLDTIVVNVK